jgi:H+/Cl- antiporter ClcA
MCRGSLFKVAPSAQAGRINQITALFNDREREREGESPFLSCVLLSIFVGSGLISGRMAGCVLSIRNFCMAPVSSPGPYHHVL